MRTKVLEILIVVVVLAVICCAYSFIVVAFCFAAKDEAEATDLIEFKFGDANDVRIEYEEPNEPTKPKIPRLNKNHLLSEGLIGFELFIPNEPEDD